MTRFLKYAVLAAALLWSPAQAQEEVQVAAVIVAGSGGSIGAGGAHAGITTLLQDNFTDTNGTGLDAHTMDTGPGWTEHQGTWTTESNQASYSAGSADMASAAAGATQGTITADVTTDASGGAPGIAWRVTDNDNGWIFIVNDAADEIRIFEVNAGFTQRASAAFTVAGNTTFALRCVISGDTFTCDVDNDTASINHTSSVFNTIERHGLFANDATETYDNFLMTDAT